MNATQFVSPTNETAQFDSSLDEFLAQWETEYKTKISLIPLFDTKNTSNWLPQKKQHFVKVFYHIRGHFHDFLWHMGSHAPDAEFKNIVLNNIAEEFSLNGVSHEQLYYDFAKALGVSIKDEVARLDSYLPFVREFNHNHLSWLASHSWPACFSAFSAYEKLDNLDYFYLYQLAESFGLSRRALTFFSVHLHVKHFDTTFKKLIGIWNKDSMLVKEAFEFIGDNQIQMWERLNNETSSYI